MRNRDVVRHILSCVGALLLVSFVILASAEENVEEALVEGNSTFAFNIFREIRDTTGNLFFSPYSLSAALAMTWAGARGSTATEMTKTLQFPSDLPAGAVHRAFTGLQQGFNTKQDGWEIAVANRLFGQEGEPFRLDYIAQLNDWYRAPLQPVDFGHTETARKIINGWVEGQTQDKVKNLFPEGSLKPDTRLVLANAIWFKGQWNELFDPKATREEPFHVSPQETVKVPMMHQQATLPFLRDDDISLVDIPYAGNELAMLVILPNDNAGLAAVEEKLQLNQYQDWLARMHTTKVRLGLPQFKLTWEREVSQELEQLGMREAFSINADFSGMSLAGGLFIAQVRHKAFVEVNEEGTEAAAASAVTMERGVQLTEPELFVADHPFIFLIHEVKTGTILFMGQLVNPDTSE